jgi:hypothetical protein
MGRLFTGGAANVPIRAQLENRFRNARFSLLVTVAFTVINMILCVGQNGMFWLFSANVPRFLTDLGMYFGGIYNNPTEAMLNAGFGTLGIGFFVGMLVVAILIVCAYFLCWLLSDGKLGWMVAALAMLGFDTLFMLVSLLFGLADMESVVALDLALHAYVLYALVDGVVAKKRLNALPADAPIYEEPKE